MEMEPENKEQTPLDGIISRVDSYRNDPKLITPETLSELYNELIDLKSVVDNEEPTEEAAPEGEATGMASMINKMAPKEASY